MTPRNGQINILIWSRNSRGNHIAHNCRQPGLPKFYHFKGFPTFLLRSSLSMFFLYRKKNPFSSPSRNNDFTFVHNISPFFSPYPHIPNISQGNYSAFPFFCSYSVQGVPKKTKTERCWSLCAQAQSLVSDTLDIVFCCFLLRYPLK